MPPTRCGLCAAAQHRLPTVGRRPLSTKTKEVFHQFPHPASLTGTTSILLLSSKNTGLFDMCTALP